MKSTHVHKTNLSQDGIDISHMITIPNLLVGSGRPIALRVSQQYQYNVEYKVHQ